MLRPGSTLVGGVLLTLATAMPAGAAEPEDTGTWWGLPKLPEQWQRQVPASPALRLPERITRDPEVERVTLKEAIGIALQNNPGIAARRLEPTRIAEGILAAQAQFDPAFETDLRSEHTREPSISALSGTPIVEQDDRNADFRLLKTLRSSTQTEIAFLNQRFADNREFTELVPFYRPRLNFSLVQPLLRNFGWDFSYLVVRVAQHTAEAALDQYEALLADFVTRVIEAYWTAIRARENVEVQRESKALADRTVEENQARVRVGLLPPVSVLEARADAALREERVIVAENELALALQRLSQIAFYRPTGTFVPRTLEPIEQAEPEEADVDVEEGIATALAARPEIHASASSVEARQLDERIAGNALLPRVDLVGSYGLNGLSGAANPQDPRPGLPCMVNAAGRCISPFAGPRGDAYDRLGSGDFQSYGFGLRLQVPLSNAQARSEHAQSRIALSQAELTHRELLSEVTLEVRQSVADVIATRKRIETSRVARDLAEENLRNQEKRHEVGMATTKDLLDFQARVTTARAAEVAAKTDHAIAMARWRRAQGRLLSHYQIVVDAPGRRGVPWFAQF
jgi:outer membrane protein TolC